ncbi:MAG: helix-turn-helix domain-containing protein [Pegethrix bostrychoides GSE-TBD4-15B]|jgi:hypothetical protein|uniref:Helix-turn-helix domain-containing protein n=1 Tax=Pegethrix bostrychoides GSE-TBD4-15B TaxID=2839662 RepID=A0A951U580_9CYAN|nr:helix-turn-helix domain-containing protein [Pegethrix bostrychoides GSE-TBD4-15B]
MTRPRALSERELELIRLYANCQLGLSPRRFYAKWAVSHEAMAQICARSPSTVRRWFSKGKHYRAPSAADLWHLALMDFLLEHCEELTPELWQQLCPGQPQPLPRPDSPST